MEHVIQEGELKTAPHTARPSWLKVKVPLGESFSRLKGLMDGKHLHTVCEEARCPNMSECWNAGTATFMILGDVCTRSCGFCAVKTGKPEGLDLEEPFRVADAVRSMGVRYAVVTSVNRDELPDGGAAVFAETIRQIRVVNPSVSIEVLIPDFRGVEWALDIVVEAQPDVLNHNMETVARLYSGVRPQAKYDRSLELLERAKRKGMMTKTGIMVGLGESEEEVQEVMRDVRRVNCDIFTIGQYLQPTKEHLPVQRYVHPDEFARYKQYGLAMGLPRVESGPLVRSSYHAEEWKRGT
ncbi:MAG: lipoyl synthase [Bacteroidota bacterium]